MSAEDWWSKWLRRSWSPLSRRRLFGDIPEMIRDMEEMMEREFGALSERAPKDLVRERTLPDGTKVKEWGPFVYGYSVIVDPDGKPQFREFGNVKPGARLGKPHIDIKEKMEPLADVMSTNGEVKVIVELPGVKKKDIQLHGTEDNLAISVDTPQRKYYKEVKLPAKVNPEQAKSSYKNGVLEVTLQKKKEIEKEKPKGKPIKIE